ncbi:ELYS-like domain-containing protein [Pleurotus pulmonarius]
MEVDPAIVPRLTPILSYFETSLNAFPWRGTRPQEIERRRAQLNDVFIFDLLLSAGGVKNPDTLFPPHDVSGLERLLGVIEASNYDTLKKECLIYWLLKWHTDGREARFSEDRCIPPQFVVLSDAYWYLDAGVDIPRAVSILSDPRINRDFVSKILHAISTSPDASPLILKYVRTAKPILTEPDDIDLYANALAESSFLEAWQHQRSFGETDLTRERLFRNFVGWCLMPTPKTSALAQLLTFPISPFEEKLLLAIASPASVGRQQSYLSPLPTLSRLSQIVLQDLICTRLIQCGRYTEAIKLDKEFTANSAAGPTSIRDDDASLIQSRIQERNRMMREVYSTLTPAERNLLDAEMDSPSGNGGKANHTNQGSQSASNAPDGDLSMSWEEIHVPLPAYPKSNASTTKTTARKSHGGLFDSISSLSRPLAASTSAPLLASSIVDNSAKPKALGESALLGSLSGRQPRVSFPPVPVTRSARLSTGSNPRLTSTLNTSQTQFTPASSMRNAFYNPPVRSLVAEEPSSRLQQKTQGGLGGEVDATMDEGASHRGESVASEEERPVEDEEGRNGDEDPESPVEELGYSVFGNRPPMQREQRDVEQSRRPSEHSATPAPPGHFEISRQVNHKEESDDSDEAPFDREEELLKLKAEVQRQHLGLPKATTRSTRASIASDAKPRSRRAAETNKDKPTKSTRSTKAIRESKASDLGRSLPGSLMDEEDSDDARAHTGLREEDDDIAPLPSQSEKASHARRSRRSRSSLSVSDLGDDEGAQTRRRSTRISAAHTASEDDGARRNKARTTTRRKK